MVEQLPIPQTSNTPCEKVPLLRIHPFIMKHIFFFLAATLNLSSNVLSFVPVADRSSRMVSFSTASNEIHPAVEGWAGKYAGDIADTTGGPEILHTEFTVQKASYSDLTRLKVLLWPTWTTKGNPKWAVGNQNAGKVMPYGELSYVVSGSLEVIPEDTGVPVIVKPGDFVTFPEGFTASWRVLEEITWHYYLYWTRRRGLLRWNWITKASKTETEKLIAKWTKTSPLASYEIGDGKSLPTERINWNQAF